VEYIRCFNDNYYCHSVSYFSSSQNRKCHSPITFSRATDSKIGHPASVTFDTTDSETIVPMHSTLPTAENKQILYIYIILLHCTLPAVKKKKMPRKELYTIQSKILSNGILHHWQQNKYYPLALSLIAFCIYYWVKIPSRCPIYY